VKRGILVLTALAAIVASAAAGTLWNPSGAVNKAGEAASWLSNWTGEPSYLWGLRNLFGLEK
jgi:hypothetical protein